MAWRRRPAALRGLRATSDRFELAIDIPSAAARASCVDFFGHALGGVADVLTAVAAGGKFVKIAMATSLSYAG